MPDHAIEQPPPVGALSGVRVIEMAGIGPGPFAAMVLADLGADVIRVERPSGGPPQPSRDVVLRNRRTIAVDARRDEGRQVIRRLIAHADVVIEGFRPGVMERLGLGPTECTADNPRLIYGRMTGWGQDGPLSATAGHDIGYIAITGALNAFRRAGGLPVPPVNLVGDLGGGALYLVIGVLSALLHARATGAGQVVDASIVDGTASLTNFVHGLRAQGGWSDEPGTNVLDTGRPYYDVYRCADGKEIAVGALEDKFYDALVGACEVADDPVLRRAVRDDPQLWPEARQRWAEVFARRTRDEWAAVFADVDACAAPVLDWDEATRHPHNIARGVFVQVDGAVQATPAPRLSRTPGSLRRPAGAPGDGDAILRECGYGPDDVDALRRGGVLG